MHERITFLLYCFALTCILATPTRTLGADFFCSDVPCLAAAISESSATPADDRIFLKAEKFTLQTPLPVITDHINGGRLEIIGSRPEPSIVERDPQASPFSIFASRTFAGLTLSNIAVKGGDPDGVRNLGPLGRLSLTSVILTENGTGLTNGGSVTIESAIFASNGLGISNHDGTIAASGLLFEGNDRILAEAGISEFRDTTFRDNNGGITTDVADLGGRLDLINSAYIWNRGSIVTNGPMLLENTTVAFNQAQGENAAITCGQCPLLEILNSTIVGNQGLTAGGIARRLSFPLGTIEIQNSIIAENLSSDGTQSDCDSRGFPQNVRSLGNNILGACDITHHATDIFESPGLAALIDDDRPGKSHFPLLESSPAIDSANPAACPATDQLGQARVGTCDIGAVEFGADTTVLTVEVDLRPRNDKNTIQPNSNALVPVAFLSSAEFNAGDIDPATVRFGPNQIGVASVRRLRDVNSDNLRDLVLQFRIADSGIRCGDSSVSIIGQTVAGRQFQGTDSISTVGCKSKEPRKPK